MKIVLDEILDSIDSETSDDINLKNVLKNYYSSQDDDCSYKGLRASFLEGVKKSLNDKILKRLDNEVARYQAEKKVVDKEALSLAVKTKIGGIAIFCGSVLALSLSPVYSALIPIGFYVAGRSIKKASRVFAKLEQDEARLRETKYLCYNKRDRLNKLTNDGLANILDSNKELIKPRL